MYVVNPVFMDVMALKARSPKCILPLWWQSFFLDRYFTPWTSLKSCNFLVWSRPQIQVVVLFSLAVTVAAVKLLWQV